MVKAWLSDRGIAYAVRDVRQDPAAAEDFLRLGFLLPPVVVVDGQAVAGYQPERLAELFPEES